MPWRRRVDADMEMGFVLSPVSSAAHEMAHALLGCGERWYFAASSHSGYPRLILRGVRGLLTPTPASLVPDGHSG